MSLTAFSTSALSLGWRTRAGYTAQPYARRTPRSRRLSPARCGRCGPPRTAGCPTIAMGIPPKKRSAFSHTFIRSSFALRPNCLAVCVVAARQDGHEDLHAPSFPDILSTTSSLSPAKSTYIWVSKHNAPHARRLSSGAYAFSEGSEVGVPVSFGMRRRVFGVQGLHRDALALQSCGVFRKQGFQLESAR